MSAWVDIDEGELDGVAVYTDGTPEWITPAQARKLAADLIAAAKAVEGALP